MSKILCCPKEKICLSEEDLKYAIEAGMLGYRLFEEEEMGGDTVYVSMDYQALVESIMLCVTAQNLTRNG